MNTKYHYCSNETFCSIINSKSIRLSSLSLSNDKTEGKLASTIFEDLAKDEPLKDDLLRYTREVEGNCHALGFCLSAEDDLLSQWRGYADNASGVAIGFSCKSLEDFAERELFGYGIPGCFKQVEYDADKQKKLMKPILEDIKYTNEQGAAKSLLENGSGNKILEAHKVLGSLGWELMPRLFQLKDKGFYEEQEWRLILAMKEHKLTSSDLKYRLDDNKLMPYKDFPLGVCEIEEVVLGPKNPNEVQMVETFLNSNEVLHVNVRRSEIPYC